jgi:uncharacterized protein (UPF0332 family)
MNLKELFEKRLLRKIQPNLEKSMKSLETAHKFLKDAEKLNKIDGSQFIILAAYTSMFHNARALLYKDGIQEKSHYAVYVYLKEKYSTELKDLLFEFNSLRDQRHEGLYGLEYSFSETDYTHAIKVAKAFQEKIKLILEDTH